MGDFASYRQSYEQTLPPLSAYNPAAGGLAPTAYGAYGWGSMAPQPGQQGVGSQAYYEAESEPSLGEVRASSVLRASPNPSPRGLPPHPGPYIVEEAGRRFPTDYRPSYSGAPPAQMMQAPQYQEPEPSTNSSYVTAQAPAASSQFVFGAQPSGRAQAQRDGATSAAPSHYPAIFGSPALHSQPGDGFVHVQARQGSGSAHGHGPELFPAAQQQGSRPAQQHGTPTRVPPGSGAGAGPPPNSPFHNIPQHTRQPSEPRHPQPPHMPSYPGGAGPGPGAGGQGGSGHGPSPPPPGSPHVAAQGGPGPVSGAGKTIHVRRGEAWNKYIAYEGCLQVSEGQRPW